VVRQRPRAGWAMPCSADDVMRVLSLVPRALWRDLRRVVFRTPTPRECPVDACVWDGTIAINAVRIDEERDVSGAHAQVVRRAGGSVARGVATFDRGVARAFMLYHVLLHEIGHFVEGSDETRAEGFALDWEHRLRRAGAIPFACVWSMPARQGPTRRHGWRERIAGRAFAGLTAAPGGDAS